MTTRNRVRINEKIDENLLNKLDYISKTIDLPKSRIFEEGMQYILKKQIKPSQKKSTRKPINLTINKDLWIKFKVYSEVNNFKLVHLFEEALSYSLKQLKRKFNI